MNSNTNSAIAGYFQDRASAQRAMKDLKAAGFQEREYDLAPYSQPMAGQYAGSDPYQIDSSDYFDNASGLSGEKASQGILITVTGARTQEARALLERDGADVSDRVNPGLAQEGVQRLQLREEHLSARKQTVQAGEVQIHKDIVTENQTLDVPVSHDELVIERHPVTDRRISETPIGQDQQEIRVPLMREEATLEKQTVVREEVEIGKRTVTQTEHLTDTVRREEARVENTGDVHVENNTDHRNDMLDDDSVMSDETARR